MHKKGVSTQVFAFIFALFFMALILAYGAKTLVNLKHISSDVELTDFVLKLRDEADSMFHFDIGSSKDISLFLPGNVERICFFNGEHAITVPHLDSALRNYLDTTTGKNVFVMPFSFAQNAFFVDHLRAGGGENPLCFLPAGKLNARLHTVLGDDGGVYVELRRLP